MLKSLPSLILSLSLFALFPSCKDKSNDPQPGTTSGTTSGTISGSTSGTTSGSSRVCQVMARKKGAATEVAYTYSHQKKIEREDFYDAAGDNYYSRVYTYASSGLMNRINNQSYGSVQTYDLYYYNGNGTLEKVSNFNLSGTNNNIDSVFYTGSQLRKIKSYDKASTGTAFKKYREFTYNSAGNVVEERLYERPNTSAAFQLTATVAYQYDSAKNPARILGKPALTAEGLSVNNITKSTLVNGGLTTVRQLSYTYTSDGYPATITENGNSSTFEYQCQ